MTMADGRRREEWQHTSNLLAMLHNRVPGIAKDDLKDASDFFPFDKPAGESGGDDDGDIEVPFETLKLLVRPEAIREKI